MGLEGDRLQIYGAGNILGGYCNANYFVLLRRAIAIYAA